MTTARVNTAQIRKGKNQERAIPMRFWRRGRGWQRQLWPSGQSQTRRLGRQEGSSLMEERNGREVFRAKPGKKRAYRRFFWHDKPSCPYRRLRQEVANPSGVWGQGSA